MYKVVIVPFPLTPLAAYGHFLGLRFGKISQHAVSVYHWRPNSPGARQTWQSDDILVLTGTDLVDRLEKLIKNSLPGEIRYPYLRLLHYVASPKLGAQMENITDMSKRLAGNWSTPQQPLAAAGQLFSKLVQSKQNPRLTGLPELIIDSTPLATPLYLPPSKLFVTLPKFDDSPAPNQKLVGYWQEWLEESNIAALTDQHITVIVGGPPGSGKTTATVTLVNEMNNLIQSLRTRFGWEAFNLSVKYLSLDLGTPVGDFIISQQGQNRDLVNNAKQRWTPEFAEAGLHAMLQAKHEHNIVIADLPGQIDGLTRLLSCGADGSIILSRDWSKVDEWKRFFAEMGQANLSQALSRSPEEGFMSTVKVYRRGHFLSGRVSGLMRVVCSWDPFLHFLAKALLFDLLPSLVTSRLQTIEKIRLSV